MKNSISKIICVMLLAITVFALNIYFSGSMNLIYAYSKNNITFEEVALTNSNFNNSPNSTSLETNPTGWTILKTSSATSGIINVNEKDSRFSSNHSNYQLESTDNPKTMNPSYDDKVLMINSKNSKGKQFQTSQGYLSNNISMNSYSFYEIRVLVYTMNDAQASIYLNGFDKLLEENENGSNHIINNSFERIITNKIWTEYTFFVQTNFDNITANLSLYLGATNNTSSIGVVFFDNISVFKVTENKYFLDIKNATNSNLKFNVITPEINFIEDYNTSEYNFDFENGSTIDTWISDGEYNSKTTILRVMNVATPDTMKRYNLPYLGSDNTKNNNYALIISSKESAFVGYTSKKDIRIKQFGLYKISINVKCDNIIGNAYITLTENDDVNLFYEEKYDFYTPISDSIKISSNSTENLKNNYRRVSFYIQGHSLYDTSVKLGLWLGAEDELSSGTVAFDNLTVEKISYNQFSSINGDSNNKIISFTTVIEDSSNVENGFFNNGKSQDIETIFPVKPESWEQTTFDSKNPKLNLWGIVNTNENKWSENGLSLANPKNPKIIRDGVSVTTSITDTNNILMIYNQNNSYQTISSPRISISKNSYYNLSFDYKTNTINPIFNFYITDNNNKVLFEDLNIESYSSEWKNYSVIIKTEHNFSELKLIFEVGKKDDKVKGALFLDNVMLKTKTLSNDDFINLVNNNAKILDLSNIGFNIKSDNLNESEIYDALLFNGNLESGVQYGDPIAYGGIISENNRYNITFPETNTNAIKNMLAISTIGRSTYSLTSKLEIDLSSESYYKFKIFIKTEFNGIIENDKNIEYGAEFSLNGLAGASIINIKSDTFKEYIIYVFVDNSTSVCPRFALVSESYETTGNSFFDSFSFDVIEKEEYENAVSSETVLKFSTSELESEDSEDVEESDSEEENGRLGGDIWIAIGTILMSVAIIVAVILFYVRKIDFKKFQVKRKLSTDYDRATTVARDAISREAEKRRDEEIKLYNKEISELEQYLVQLEEENKERIAKQRAQTGKVITRRAEKEFKQYAGTRGKILKEIEKIKKKISELNSPEWLIQQEKYISAEQLKVKTIPDDSTQKSVEIKGKSENKNLKNDKIKKDETKENIKIQKKSKPNNSSNNIDNSEK